MAERVGLSSGRVIIGNLGEGSVKVQGSPLPRHCECRMSLGVAVIINEGGRGLAPRLNCQDAGHGGEGNNTCLEFGDFVVLLSHVHLVIEGDVGALGEIGNVPA